MTRRTRAALCALVPSSLLLLALGPMAGCGGPPPASTADNGPSPSAARALGRPGELHLRDVRQLTFGGENAEAYWSWDGRELVLQARRGDEGCDRIYRMPVTGSTHGNGEALVPVSSGKGATTCSYFMPGNREILYASTHLGGEACPPKPDQSQGYVWALHPTYDIFKGSRDGSNLVRLTETPGYDAEATVCGKDGSIVFTSVRDGDIDLYRMDADGKNVRRLTTGVGYDGGAFFNADCSKIVWRASRPKPGKEQDDYKALLQKNLVRPTKLELYVANADGSDPVQVTYLNAASFAPYWHPSQRRILFSSNYGDPKHREFDIFAVDVAGTNLERVTNAPGFDGFPMFSPDGALLVFASNRATAPGAHDTNVFLARWNETAAERLEETAADRTLRDVTWLADPARDGRGVGTKGLEAAGAYVEERFRALGLAPAGDGSGYRQAFAVTTDVRALPSTALEIEGKALAAEDFVVMGFSPAKAAVHGELVLAGYGVVAKDVGLDDYARLDVKGKIVVVRRFVPEDPRLSTAEAQRRHGDVRRKAWAAKERGAVGLVVVDDPVRPASAPKDWKAPDEARLPTLQPEGYGDAGLPVVVARRSALHPIVARLEKKERVRAHVRTELEPVRKDAFNVVARVEAAPASGAKLPGVVVVGAHYDHLGLGGRYSLAPDTEAPHGGADDNASGTAALLEVARFLAAHRGELRRDVLVAAFSGEESGVLGSSYFTRAAAEGKAGAVAPKDVVAMLNMDMVGRVRDNRLQVLGTDTAAEWPSLVTGACDAARIDCAAAGDGGYGPSDQMPFYVAGVPVLHFFSGAHADYHKPSDVADKINAAGLGQTAVLVADLAKTLAAREGRLTFKAGAEGPAPRGDMRSFHASLGTIPDYGGPGAGKKGVLLAGVRPGGAAEKGGLRRGDVLVRLGKHDIASVEDLMYVLNAAKPGETVKAVVLREGKELALDVIYQEGARTK